VTAIEKWSVEGRPRVWMRTWNCLGTVRIAVLGVKCGQRNIAGWLSVCVTNITKLMLQRMCIAGVCVWQVGRQPQAPRFRPKVVLISCQAIFSGKLEMLIHALFQTLLQGQIP
jgi:hypothetical protein